MSNLDPMYQTLFAEEADHIHCRFRAWCNTPVPIFLTYHLVVLTQCKYTHTRGCSTLYSDPVYSFLIKWCFGAPFDSRIGLHWLAMLPLQPVTGSFQCALMKWVPTEAPCHSSVKTYLGSSLWLVYAIGTLRWPILQVSNYGRSSTFKCTKFQDNASMPILEYILGIQTRKLGDKASCSRLLSELTTPWSIRGSYIGIQSKAALPGKA